MFYPMNQPDYAAGLFYMLFIAIGICVGVVMVAALIGAVAGVGRAARQHWCGVLDRGECWPCCGGPGGRDGGAGVEPELEYPGGGIVHYGVGSRVADSVGSTILRVQGMVGQCETG